MRGLVADRESLGRELLITTTERRFVVEDFEPAYLRQPRAELAARAETAVAELTDCRACPRDCRVDRTTGELGTCNTGRHAIVSSAFAHFGEEDCLRGWNGSGTIFFGLCNLRCVFCQNWDISQRESGRSCTADQIADLMLDLQDQGCHNINFVTPEHVAPQVAGAIVAAVDRGLGVPIVYNTSAYDSLVSLELMDGLVDIYMPDFKFWEPTTARRLARAGDYPDTARTAITEMHRQVGDLTHDGDGLACRGLLVRHLVMPGLEDETAAIFEWLADLSPDTFVNVMGQYRPEHKVSSSNRFKDIDRRPVRSEMESAFAAARLAGLHRLDRRILPW
jgi:putative pyruvate formate lyase activating enzyme